MVCAETPPSPNCAVARVLPRASYGFFSGGLFDPDKLDADIANQKR
jgi:hypothetical protein